MLNFSVKLKTDETYKIPKINFLSHLGGREILIPMHASETPTVTRSVKSNSIQVIVSVEK
jgi:hypothetical protein